MGAPIGYVNVYFGMVPTLIIFPMGEFLRLMDRIPELRELIKAAGREGFTPTIHIGA